MSCKKISKVADDAISRFGSTRQINSAGLEAVSTHIEKLKDVDNMRDLDWLLDASRIKRKLSGHTCVSNRAYETSNLKMYSIGKSNLGKPLYGYEFYNNDNLIFIGEDFQSFSNPDQASIELMGFLTVRPGDTDEGFFENYTSEQLDWASSEDCEFISSLIYDEEE